MKKTSLLVLASSAALALSGCSQAEPHASSQPSSAAKSGASASADPSAQAPSPYATGSPAAQILDLTAAETQGEASQEALASLSTGPVYDPASSLTADDLASSDWQGFEPVGSVQFTGKTAYTVPEPNISFPSGKGHVQRSVRVLITCTGSEYRLNFGGSGYSSSTCGAQRPPAYISSETFQGNKVWFSVPAGEHGWARIYVKDVAVAE